MILITGGMGFIGLHTAKRVLEAGEDVVLMQHQARREPDFLKGKGEAREPSLTARISPAVMTSLIWCVDTR